MIGYVARGELPKKHHITFEKDGQLCWEECFTREGFDGAFSILYHSHRPHEQEALELPADSHFSPSPRAPDAPLRKRHLRGFAIQPSPEAPLVHRKIVLANDDVALGVSRPGSSDSRYFVNGDADTLIYVYAGAGILRTVLGDVRFSKDDYVYIPKGILHRFALESDEPSYWLTMEFAGGIHIPRQFRNDTGQLRMDAPFCVRDFRMPEFRGPMDEGIRETIVKRRDRFHMFSQRHSPLDVVGWDGNVYPWAFPILNFQPRAGLVHLPPTSHGTFAARGALVCSFVPRMVDFHPQAIPCPYPHSSVDVDEFIFYVRGNFTSRRGISPMSMSFHPAGIPHGPHPGAYEKSIGHQRTDELAVMLDTAKPLDVTVDGLTLDDAGYQGSFVA